MFGGFFKRFAVLFAASISMLLLGVPAFAAVPNTGDGSGMMIPIVIGLLVVSVVLVVVYVLLSKKKK